MSNGRNPLGNLLCKTDSDGNLLVSVTAEASAIDFDTATLSGVVPVANGGTGSSDTLDFLAFPNGLSGSVPVINGGTAWIGTSSRGALMTSGNSITFRNPGVGDGSGYSVATTGMRGTCDTALVFGLAHAGTFAWVMTPQHQGGDGYGALWITNIIEDAQGIYIKDASATTVKIAWFTDLEGETLSTTALTVGTRYFCAVTIDAAGAGKFYVNGVLDGTFSTISLNSFLEFFSNNYMESLRASFLAEVAYYPSALTAPTLLNQYTVGNNGGTATSVYEALLVTDGATHLWKLNEADPGPIDPAAAPFAFEDSVGSLDINLQGLVTAVNSATSGLTLLAQGEGRAPAYGRPTKFITTAPDAVDITPVLGGLAADDITYQLNTQAGGTLTVKNFTGGTPSNGQSWLLKVKCTNVQTLSFESNYVGGTTALPTATTGGGKIDYIAFLYDAVNSKWDCVSPVVGGF